MSLTRNMGSADRIARIVIGALLIVLALTGVVSPWGWIGVIALATALTGVCPLYSIFGIRTCKSA